MRSSDCLPGGLLCLPFWEDNQTVAFGGSKSRNKVSVGEPAEGSLPVRSRIRDSRMANVACSSGLGLSAHELTRFAPDNLYNSLSVALDSTLT